MSERFDFHTHTLASDGSLTPTQLVEAARANGVTAFALTDHDTVEGIAEAQRTGTALGVEVIAGIELSVSENDGARALHVLGLAIDPSEPGLRVRLERMHRERHERVTRIVEKLRALGLAVDAERVRAFAAGGSVGRPHVARALVEIGACRDVDDAFVRYLRRGRPAYEPHAEFSARDAIALVHGAGGVAVLAHPPLSGGVDSPGGLEAFVERLVPFGLDGVEVWHPSHKANTMRRLRRIARDHGLLESGGSDFHGEDRPDVQVGRGRAGGLHVKRPTYDALMARAREHDAARRLTLSGAESTLGRPS